MAEPLASRRRSPLPGFTGFGTSETVRLTALPFRTLVELRVATAADGSGADVVGLERALGFELPGPCRSGRADAWMAVWLAPGWWLLDGPESEPPAPDVDAEQAVEAAIVSRLRAVGSNVSAVDVSAQRTTLELAGPRAASVLAHGCSLDLHPRVFGPGQAAQTMLAKAQVMLVQLDATPTYRIWVRASFARYLREWLLDACTEYLGTA